MTSGPLSEGAGVWGWILGGGTLTPPPFFFTQEPEDGSPLGLKVQGKHRLILVVSVRPPRNTCRDGGNQDTMRRPHVGLGPGLHNQLTRETTLTLK